MTIEITIQEGRYCAFVDERLVAFADKRCGREDLTTSTEWFFHDGREWPAGVRHASLVTIQLPCELFRREPREKIPGSEDPAAYLRGYAIRLLTNLVEEARKRVEDTSAALQQHKNLFGEHCAGSRKLARDSVGFDIIHKKLLRLLASAEGVSSSAGPTIGDLAQFAALDACAPKPETFSKQVDLARAVYRSSDNTAERDVRALSLEVRAMRNVACAERTELHKALAEIRSIRSLREDLKRLREDLERLREDFEYHKDPDRIV